MCRLPTRPLGRRTVSCAADVFPKFFRIIVDCAVLLYCTGYNYLTDATAELGGNPVSKHQIRPEYGDEQADTGGDG